MPLPKPVYKEMFASASASLSRDVTCLRPNEVDVKLE